MRAAKEVAMGSSVLCCAVVCCYDTNNTNNTNDTNDTNDTNNTTTH